MGTEPTLEYRDFTGAAWRAIMHARTETATLDDPRVGTDALILGILRGSSGGATILDTLGVTYEKVEAAIYGAKNV